MAIDRAARRRDARRTRARTAVSAPTLAVSARQSIRLVHKEIEIDNCCLFSSCFFGNEKRHSLCWVRSLFASQSTVDMLCDVFRATIDFGSAHIRRRRRTAVSTLIRIGKSETFFVYISLHLKKKKKNKQTTNKQSSRVFRFVFLFFDFIS
jgi:hypothetical protein